MRLFKKEAENRHTFFRHRNVIARDESVLAPIPSRMDPLPHPFPPDDKRTVRIKFHRLQTEFQMFGMNKSVQGCFGETNYPSGPLIARKVVFVPNRINAGMVFERAFSESGWLVKRVQK
ncbi:hypothetical protein AVEN_214746-1 [Araneus ventricosus]|uniref:Uncharacterized protein n=1 Tax=Araneus ventricosus TaxID=182803 RepID=A0A4Y2IH73_ARAVE|nr:hypothetical protein AVEN_214746-1 [Araneus ventricosus]